MPLMRMKVMAMTMTITMAMAMMTKMTITMAMTMTMTTTIRTTTMTCAACGCLALHAFGPYAFASHAVAKLSAHGLPPTAVVSWVVSWWETFPTMIPWGFWPKTGARSEEHLQLRRAWGNLLGYAFVEPQTMTMTIMMDDDDDDDDDDDVDDDEDVDDGDDDDDDDDVLAVGGLLQGELL